MNFLSSTQTISWFRDRYREGSLRIKPPYQRKPVWAARQKCYLIESILMDLPIPELYIQQTTRPDGETTYDIVDGQQRIRTVLQFIGAELDPDEQQHNKFVLDKLDASSPWYNQAFAGLDDTVKTKFYEYVFAVRYLKAVHDEAVRDMFRRLNKFLTPLKPQELRNATYSGPFSRLTVKLADEEYWAVNRIMTASAIRRMNDVEFVSELLIGTLHGPQGGSPEIIDNYYEQYEDYDDEFPGQRKAETLFQDTRQTIEKVLPNLMETRWANKTDFYTLFVALAHMLKTKKLVKVSLLRKALDIFAADVEKRFTDDRARVSGDVTTYVAAVQKGANDKKRRADRHNALLSVVEPVFKDHAFSVEK